MIEVHAATAEVLDLVQGIYRDQGGMVLLRSREGDGALIGFERCVCCATGGVINLLEEAGNTHLSPVSYGSDGETYQFLSPGKSFTPETLRQLGRKVEVVRLDTRPLSTLALEGRFMIPVGALLHELTDRQRAALVTAIERGYYEVPRRVTLEQISPIFGISRQAYETLLRKGEEKIVTLLNPYLQVDRTLPSVAVGDGPNLPEVGLPVDYRLPVAARRGERRRPSRRGSLHEPLVPAPDFRRAQDP
jgi:predicted DNA binding protein